MNNDREVISSAEPDAVAAESSTATPDNTPANTPAHAPIAGAPIVARSGQYYRNTRYIMTAVTIIMGFWFLYDGFVRYPAENAKIDELKKQQSDAISRHDDSEISRVGTQLKDHVSHSPTDLFIQRILAFALPPAGILLLLWAIYNSRGEYRLSDDVLYVPGHPPVPLGSIQELDETLWDRKGIAYVRYAVTSSGGGPETTGRIKIDDFIYDRVPTDRIMKRIQSSLQPATVDATMDGGISKIPPSTGEAPPSSDTTLQI